MILTEHLERKLTSLPTRPGVYLMKDSGDQIIYVGKAKSLRLRVRSYFQSGAEKSIKTQVLVAKVVDLEYIVTDTEKEALILENSLIKKHRPRYNVNLKDDKTYPSIRFSVHEDYPRLSFVRRIEKDGALYFGPYASANAVRDFLHIIHKLFPLRQCAQATFRRRKRPCINCQLKRCLAPCCADVPKDEYDQVVKEVLLLLRGQDQELLTHLTAEMEAAAQALNFERAGFIRDQIAAIQKLLEKQKMVSPRFVDQDVIGYYRQDHQVEFYVLFVRQGRLLGNQSLLVRQVNLDDQEVVSSFVTQYYHEGRFIPAEVIVPLALESQGMIEEWLREKKGKKVRIIHPQRGERTGLLGMAVENAKLTWENRRSRQELMRRTLEEACQRFHLRRLPQAIECFDISNLFGNEAVGSMVRFEDGEPVKAKYRHYRIKTVDQADDYGMMYEVIMRRLSRESREKDYPDLIIVDGGKGQLQVARQVMSELGIYDIDAIGLAKSRFHDSQRTPEKVFVANRKDPVILMKRQSVLHLLQRIRDESHRFAITYHRKLREKKQTISVLDDIPGIGPVKKKNLLKHFGSLQRVQSAGKEELESAAAVSRNDAERIYQFFRKSSEQNVR